MIYRDSFIDNKIMARNGFAPLPSLLRASAQDRANANMRTAGRTKWNDEDWNLMVDFLDSWTLHLFGEGDWGHYCFQVAGDLEKAGAFTLKSTAEEIVAAVNAAIRGPAMEVAA